MREGDLVSGFELPDQNGELRSLSGLLAAEPLVLFFYPAATRAAPTHPVERELQRSRIQHRSKTAPDQTFPMAERELDTWREKFEVPDADELSGSRLPSPPPGDETWFDWAQRFWPSLARGLKGRLPER